MTEFKRKINGNDKNKSKIKKLKKIEAPKPTSYNDDLKKHFTEIM